MRGLDPTTFFALHGRRGASRRSAIVPLALTKADAPQLPRALRLDFAMIRRLAPVALAGAFVAGACNGASISLAPIYALQIGVAPRRCPCSPPPIVIGSALGVYPVGRLSDRMDRRLDDGVAMGSARWSNSRSGRHRATGGR